MWGGVCRLGEQQVGMQSGDILKAGGGEEWRESIQPWRRGSRRCRSEWLYCSMCNAGKETHRMETLVVEVDVGER